MVFVKIATHLSRLKDFNLFHGRKNAVNARKSMKQQKECAVNNCEDIKCPEEIRMEFVCRILRLFKRALKMDKEAPDDKGAGKSI